MHVSTIILGMAALALATPTPQVADLVEGPVEDVPIVSVPIGGGSDTVVYDAAAAIAEAASEYLEDLVADSTTKRSLGRRTSTSSDVCTNPQPPGYGTATIPDKADAFLANTAYSSQASSAITPDGFDRSFLNKQGATSTSAYLGYKTYRYYKPADCATDCRAKKGCSAFNIYFERDPTYDPSATCKDPASTVNIKCSFWGVPIYQESATNTGQYRYNFHVVIAGSNGYNVHAPTCSPPDGWSNTGPQDLNCAINDPSGCSYLRSADGEPGAVYDPDLCKTACQKHNEYTAQHPENRYCNYYNTYMLLRNGQAYKQGCGLYEYKMDPSTCKNYGSGPSPGAYTIQYSKFVSKNGAASEPDTCSKPVYST